MSQVNNQNLENAKKIILTKNNLLTDSHIQTEGSKSNISKVKIISRKVILKKDQNSKQ